MNLIRHILFSLLFILAVLLIGCSHNSNTSDSQAMNKSEREQDSLQLVDLKPEGYTLLDSQLIDRDSAKEYVLYFRTITHTPCDYTESNNCFLNELFIAKKVNKTWSVKYRFLLQPPLPTDSVNHMHVDFSNPTLLVVTSHYRPTCCSGIHVSQYYHFEKDLFFLDSLTHSVSTTSGHESYSWDYTVDVLRKTCHFATDYLDPENNKGTSTQSVFDLKIEKTPTILSKNSIEDFVPEDSLKHWY